MGEKHMVTVPEEQSKEAEHDQLGEEDVSLEELIELNERRITTYALLSRLYRREIDQAYLDELHAARFPAGAGDERIAEGYRLMATYLSNLHSDSLRDLGRDFVRCFIGQGMNTFSAAYPYESVYTSPDRMLMQDARDEVLAVYRSCGLDKRKTWKETEDHLGAELEFMQIMAQRLDAALRADDVDQSLELLAVQHDFLDKHLNSWVPMMVEDLEKFSQTDFYRGVGLLTEGFLELDQEFVESVGCDDDGQ